MRRKHLFVTCDVDGNIIAKEFERWSNYQPPQELMQTALENSIVEIIKAAHVESLKSWWPRFFRVVIEAVPFDEEPTLPRLPE